MTVIAVIASAGPDRIVREVPRINVVGHVRSRTDAEEEEDLGGILGRAVEEPLSANAPPRSHCRMWTCSSGLMSTASIHSRARSR